MKARHRSNGVGLGTTFGAAAGLVMFGSMVLAHIRLRKALVTAASAGAAFGIVTNLLVKQRPLSLEERRFAEQVFWNSLPPPDRIILTNLRGLQGRAFTMPGVDGKIYIHLGAAFRDPLGHTSMRAYSKDGQLLIHELTHVWQIAHGSFLPGFLLSGIIHQARYYAGTNVYAYGPPKPAWSDFNLEQQAAIVDQWFAGSATRVVPNRTPMDPDDPYFEYIQENIRKGRM